MAKKRKTTEEFKREVFELVGDEYTVLGTYNGSGKPILMKHNICGFDEWTPTPNNFLKGGRCKKCRREDANNKLRKTHQQFIKEVEDIFDGEFEVLGEYVDSKIHIDVLHKPCGRVYPVIPNSLILGHNCRDCSDKEKGLRRRKSHEQFVKEVSEAEGDKYTVVTEYEVDYKHITMRHNEECGAEYPVTPSNFLSGYRCPICRESKGERAIREYLAEININFKRQYVFEELVGLRGQPLRFDFAICDNSGSLIALIEYDGEYHFMPVNGDELLEYQQSHDKLKDEYCNANNIPLLRIPYWEIDIFQDKITTFIEKEVLIIL